MAESQPAPAPMSAKDMEHVDVLVIGAGLSGVAAGYHLQARCPSNTYAILEAREAIGGTWDLFRYPGIRSDSDMFTLGYAFKPWREAKSIADGPAILKYVQDTAREYGVDRHIRFRHKVVSADWSSTQQRWTVTALRSDTGETVQIACSMLISCSGYYRYDHGYTPTFEGMDRFKGVIVHPQLWPKHLDHSNKQVVVIGSGATAVTLVPAMAEKAAKVTMLQRSPTYVVSRPARDRAADLLRRMLPQRAAYKLIRWRNILVGLWFFNLSRKHPDMVKRFILRHVREALPEKFDVERHFTPRYNPWDQRLCLVPDGDLFNALRDGSASVVTDTIERFTETGIRLASGAELPADIVVTATGLDLLFLGGITVTIDGAPKDLSKALTYKGVMYEGVPNLISVFGYTNASWTLKCDLTLQHACRIINYMDRRGLRTVTPRSAQRDVATEPWLDFSSGYVQRAIANFPKQGSRRPWKVAQNYPLDVLDLGFGRVNNPALDFR